MRGWLLLVAAAACAQDNRGFVNERLVTQNFFKNSLKARPVPTVLAPKAQATPPTSACAIPRLEIPGSQDVDSEMAFPTRKPTGDDKMVLPTIPVCGKR